MAASAAGVRRVRTTRHFTSLLSFLGPGVEGASPSLAGFRKASFPLP